MKVSDAYPSKYLKAADIPRDVAVIIDYVDMETMEQSDDTKPVVYFQGKTKGLVLNKTNALSIEMAYGDEMDDWRGKEITLFATTTMYGGKRVPCLRVRVPNQPTQTGPDTSVINDELASAADGEAPADDIPF